MFPLLLLDAVFPLLLFKLAIQLVDPITLAIGLLQFPLNVLPISNNALSLEIQLTPFVFETKTLRCNLLTLTSKLLPLVRYCNLFTFSCKFLPLRYCNLFTFSCKFLTLVRGLINL